MSLLLSTIHEYFLPYTAFDKKIPVALVIAMPSPGKNWYILAVLVNVFSENWFDKSPVFGLDRFQQLSVFID